VGALVASSRKKRKEKNGLGMLYYFVGRMRDIWSYAEQKKKRERALEHPECCWLMVAELHSKIM